MRRVIVERTRRLLDDFFKVDEAYLRFEQFDGRMSPTVRRLSFERGDAVAAVLVDRDAACVVLGEQFRYPTHEKGPGWILEAVAGMIEPGESPEETLRREVQEELGYTLERVELLYAFYLSPGGSSERVFLYYAEVTHGARSGGGGGVAAEHEDLRVVEVPLRQLDDVLRAGRILDAKTLVGLLWLQRRARENVRGDDAPIRGD